ncbi:MAG: hypothetical protein ACYST6_12315 [Planctomycetota bacterium]|jgi:hypothetical protein
MPIVDGRYEAKISTTFRSTKEAIEAIKDKIAKSRRVRISGIPMGLLKKLLPVLKGKDVKIILPLGEKAKPELREVGEVAVTKARIYKDHKGTEANVGSIYFSDRMFSVAWVGDKILEIDAMDYDKCVKCMRGMFDVGWRYSEK